VQQVDKTIENIRHSLAAGGIGIGIPVGYLPDVKPAEVFRIYQFAGENRIPIFTHVREGGIMAVQQVIADAVLTRAPLHIVHINSSTLGQISLAIEMVKLAKQQGFDISTELYPYTAASTGLQTSIFDEGWQQRLGLGMLTCNGLKQVNGLPKKKFDQYRKTGGIVIIHSMKPEWIQTGIAAPGVMIASDGMMYSKLAHPRTAGTFSRVLGKYVREDKVIDLITALEKMTLLPAKRLENIAPIMRFKGRIQVGADADITILIPTQLLIRQALKKGWSFQQVLNMLW
jgi:dihydroorotase